MLDFKFLAGLVAVFFMLWFMGGGLSRQEAKEGPFLKPLSPVDSGEIYGPGEADGELGGLASDLSFANPFEDLNTPNIFGDSSNNTSTETTNTGTTLPPSPFSEINESYNPKGEIASGPYKGWKFIDVDDNFSVLLPPGWWGVRKTSMDSLSRGLFTNGDTKLSFEYGKDTNELRYEAFNTHQIIYGQIDGEPTKFVRPKNSFANVTGAFIKKSRRKELTITTNDALDKTEENLIFAIIQTVRF